MGGKPCGWDALYNATPCHAMPVGANFIFKSHHIPRFTHRPPHPPPPRSSVAVSPPSSAALKAPRSNSNPNSNSNSPNSTAARAAWDAAMAHVRELRGRVEALRHAKVSLGWYGNGWVGVKCDMVVVRGVKGRELWGGVRVVVTSLPTTPGRCQGALTTDVFISHFPQSFGDRTAGEVAWLRARVTAASSSQTSPQATMTKATLPSTMIAANVNAALLSTTASHVSANNASGLSVSASASPGPRYGSAGAPSATLPGGKGLGAEGRAGVAEADLTEVVERLTRAEVRVGGMRACGGLTRHCLTHTHTPTLAQLSPSHPHHPHSRLLSSVHLHSPRPRPSWPRTSAPAWWHWRQP